jgi:hypothetical protein
MNSLHGPALPNQASAVLAQNLHASQPIGAPRIHRSTLILNPQAIRRVRKETISTIRVRKARNKTTMPQLHDATCNSNPSFHAYIVAADNEAHWSK